MVDPITNSGAISTLLRAQTSTLNSINNIQQNVQTQVNRAANGARPTTVLPIKTAGATDANLPRGSLVDILA